MQPDELEDEIGSDGYGLADLGLAGLAIRWIGGIALAGVVMSQLVGVVDEFGEGTPLALIRAAFVAITLGVLGALIVARPSRQRIAWRVGVAVCLAGIVGFMWSRAFGLLGSDDRGDWGNTVGIWSTTLEWVYIAVGAYVIGDRR